MMSAVVYPLSAQCCLTHPCQTLKADMCPYLPAPSAFSLSSACRKLSDVCLLKVATRMYPSLLSAPLGPTAEPTAPQSLVETGL